VLKGVKKVSHVNPQLRLKATKKDQERQRSIMKKVGLNALRNSLQTLDTEKLSPSGLKPICGTAVGTPRPTMIKPLF
jgi:hypothetical protein